MGAPEIELELEVRRGGVLVGQGPASLAACREDALFRGVLAGRFANDGSMPALCVEPRFAASGAPAVAGLDVWHEGELAGRYPREVFAAQARALVEALVAREELAAGDETQWSVALRERPAEGGRFAAHVTRAPFPLREGELPDLGHGEFGVVLEVELLRRLQQEVASGGPLERAWLLLGELRLDRARSCAELRVAEACGVEPGQGGASESHFSFDPACFVALSRAARGRADGLVPAGWAHSHPPCERCATSPQCMNDTLFYSSPDVAVHAAAFGASPYAVGLVAGKARALPAARPAFRLYGWREARVAPIPFRVMGPGAQAWLAEQRHGFEEEL